MDFGVGWLFVVGKKKCQTAVQTERSRLDHTTYSRNNMGQKCEGNCGLWVLNEIIKNIYPENMKKK